METYRISQAQGGDHQDSKIPARKIGLRTSRGPRGSPRRRLTPARCHAYGSRGDDLQASSQPRLSQTCRSPRSQPSCVASQPQPGDDDAPRYQP